MKLNEFMENSVIIMKVKYEGYVYSNRTFIFVYTIKIENIFLLFRIFFSQYNLKCTAKYQV